MKKYFYLQEWRDQEIYYKCILIQLNQLDFVQRNFLQGGIVILPRGCVLVFARNIFYRTDAAILCYQREQWLHNVNGLFPYASLLILFSFAACTYSPGFLYWAAYRRQLAYPSCEVFWKAEPFTRTTGRHLRVAVPSDCCANLFSYILFLRFWFLSNSRNVRLLA